MRPLLLPPRKRMLTRRGLLAAGVAGVCAPAVVKAQNLLYAVNPANDPVVKTKAWLSNPANAFPSVMASPPTITNLTNFENPPVSGYQYIDLNGGSIYVNNNAPLTVNFTTKLNDQVVHDMYTASGANPFGSAVLTSAAWQTSAAILWVLFTGSTNWNMLVDSGNGPQFISGTTLGQTQGGEPPYLAQIDFGSSAPRKFLFFTSSYVSGIFVGPTDTVTPYNLQTAGMPSIAVMGDSYTGIAGTYMVPGLAMEIALNLGITRVGIDEVGGSSYAENNAGYLNGLNNALYRLMPPGPGLNYWNADIPIFLLGINDLTASGMAQNCNTVTLWCRDLAPTAIITALGPWCPIGTQATNGSFKYPGIKANIYSSMMAIRPPWVFIDNLLGEWYNSSGKSGSAIIPALQGPSGWTGGVWQTGIGYVDNPTGTGNGDTWVSSDMTHPTLVGCDGLAQLTASAMRSAIRAL